MPGVLLVGKRMEGEYWLPISSIKSMLQEDLIRILTVKADQKKPISSEDYIRNLIYRMKHIKEA